MAKSAIAIARAKARRRNRDYVKHSAVSDITAEQELAMRRKARKCPMCGTSLTSKPGLPNSKHLDHIIPICVGGTHTHGNVRIVCASCNLTRPKDGRDYAGPVTLWAQGEVVTGRASTTCRKGLHPWAPENIEVAANGKRRCKPCRQASDRLRRKGRKHPPRPRKICQCGARFAAPGHTLMCPDCVLKATREALALRFADELSWGEIATRVGYGTAEGIRYRVMQTGALPPRQPVAPRQSKPERTPCQCGPGHGTTDAAGNAWPPRPRERWSYGSRAGRSG